MRGAGCIINDIWDRDIDRQVERTKTRPLASGTMSLGQAIGILTVMMLLGGVILLQFNHFTIWMGIASLPLVVMYPLMKRITWWPQIVLGLTFSWGALMGWASLNGYLGWPPILLYFACLFWTLGYDTIYAHQDLVDDEKAGVKSTARLFGRRSKQLIALCYLIFIILLTASGMAAGLSYWFYAGLPLVAAHLIWQVWTVDTSAPVNCLERFRSNRDVGLIVLLIITAGAL